MRSDLMKKGVERAPHRSLMKALGLTDEEINQPIIGIANSFNEVIPGHMHLNNLVKAVKEGIRLLQRRAALLGRRRARHDRRCIDVLMPVKTADTRPSPSAEYPRWL